MIEKQPRHRAAVTQLGMSAVSWKVSQRGFIPVRGSRAPARRARGDASARAANDNDASVTQRNVIGRRPLFTWPLAGAALTGAIAPVNAAPASGQVKSGRRPMTFRWVTEASLSFAARADASPRARRAGARLPLTGMKPRWDTFQETADMPSCVTAAR